MNCRSTSITVDTSCAVYISILLWSTRQHCCMCGTENNRRAVATELCLWANRNQQQKKPQNNNQKPKTRNRNSLSSSGIFFRA